MQTSAVTLSPIGMNKDSGPGIHNPQEAMNILNMRVLSTDDTFGTTSSLTTEKGNAKITLYDSTSYYASPQVKTSVSIYGAVIGKCILKDSLIFFTTGHSNRDRIYKIDKKGDDYILALLFRGILNFSLDYPIEAYSIFENESIQKVYWTDNYNQPRLINTARTLDTYDETVLYTGFDFVSTLPLKETVSIIKTAGNGVFPSGVIQYAFTYFQNNGQESKIFAISDLYNLSFRDRGGSPEENIACSFDISIANASTFFDYIRIYSIVRTSVDGTPIVKKVADIPVSSFLKEEDTTTEPVLVTTNMPCVGFSIAPQGTENSFSWGYKAQGSEAVIPLTWEEALAHLYAVGETLIASGTFTVTLFNSTTQGDIQSITITDGSLEFPITEATSKGTTDAYSYQVYDENIHVGWVNYTIQFKYSTSTTAKISYYQQGIHTKNSFNFTDTNTTGETVSPTHLLYIGGSEILAKTMAIKDNTLFLGNITLLVKPVGTLALPSTTLVKDFVSNASNITIQDIDKPIGHDSASGSYYGYQPESLNVPSYNTFKNREYYRLGIQGQYKTGEWSEPLFITDHKVAHSPQLSSTELIGTSIKVTINSTDLVDTLLNNGFLKVRPVVVYPSIAEREVIAQGVINPTLFNVEDRYQNAPTNINSWYFRPMLNTTFTPSTSIPGVQGVPVEFRHYKLLPSNNYSNSELQVNGVAQVNDGNSNLIDKDDIYLGVAPGTTNGLDLTTSEKFVNSMGDRFAVDQNLVTFHSPDVEFDESIQVLDKTNLKFRIIGFAHITGDKSELDINTSTGTQQADAQGFVERNYGVPNYSLNGCNILPSCPAYNDKRSGLYWNYVVYTWNASKSLNGFAPTDDVRYGLLERKNMANLRYAGYNTYLTDENIWTPDNQITPVEVFDPTSDKMLLLKAPSNSGLTKITYQGIVDKAVSKKRKVYYYGTDWNSSEESSLEGWTEAYNVYTKDITEPSYVKFNTSKHAVFAFNWSAIGQQIVAPTIVVNSTNINPVQSSSHNPFWKDSLQTIVNSEVTVDTVATKGGGLWIGELYRDVDTDVIFGGKNQRAFENNQWLPGGDTVELVKNTNIVLTYTNGDSYFQRYDCLKTYPQSQEDTECLVEIGSFLVETHVNLDGRYDRNRGSLTNKTTTPLNYNLLNSIYTQKNNYFNYKGLDYVNFRTDLFDNTIVWTNPKLNGEIIDSFSNVNMVNTMDMDGSLGSINALKLYNNNIIGFQDRGIFTFLYNSRVQIPTSDGVPIEMASSTKVEGQRYISTSTGCSNKESICETPSGLYYIDGLNKSFRVLSIGDSQGIALIDLSEKAGFRSWFNNHVDYEDSHKWNPTVRDSFSLDYDGVTKDVYILNKDYCLVYSEPLQRFCSFYNYESSPYIYNAWSSTFSLLNTKVDGDYITDIWKHWDGEYSTFYGILKKSEITYLVNPNPVLNKYFNVVEANADYFNFDILQSKCGPSSDQQGILALVDILGKPSTLKKKWNMYRMPVPRASNTKQSRMTGPWLQLNLSQMSSNKSILHNLNVYYNY